MNRRAWLGVGMLVVLVGAGLAIKPCGKRSSPGPASAGGEGVGGVVAGGGRGGTAGGGVAGGGAAAAFPSWFGQPGMPDRRIAGRVTLDGQPVDGAEVRLWNYLMAASGIEPPVVKTGADGRFDLGLWRAGGYWVGAISPGLAPAGEFIDLGDPKAKPPSDQLELRLAGCAASLYGTVFDASGGPIAGAWVRRDRVIGVTTGSDGAYDLCLPRGEPTVYVDADGYGAVALQISAIGRIKRDIVLVPEATIVGRVVRKGDGSPVAGAAIHAWTRNFGRERNAEITTLSGADGRFQVGRIGPGRYSLSAETDTMFLSAPADVTVAVGQTSEEVILALDEASIIRGRVMAGGQPVAGVDVMAIRKAPSKRSWGNRSLADGSFVLRAVPRGEVVFTVSGHEVLSPAGLRVELAEHDGVIVEVAPQGKIRGRVVRRGKPVPRALVQSMRFQDTSEEDGSYELEGLPPGEYEIYAHSYEEGAFSDKRSAKVTLAKGETKEGVDLELDAGATISGTVVDEQGKPLAGVFVRWMHVTTGDQGSGITKADGSYVCDTMTGGGTYRAVVRPNDGPVSPLPPVKGEHPPVELTNGDSVVEGVRLEVRLVSRTIEGRVVDTAGQPLVDARVLALAMEPGKEPVFNTWLQLPSATSDVGGNFTIRDLPDGRYAVMARGVTGGEGLAKDVPAGTTNLRLTVALPGSIEGELIGYSETPVVYAQPTAGSWQLTRGVIDGGRFTITGLAAGSYLVTAQTVHEGDAEVVEVRVGAASRLNLTSQGSGVIEGTYRELHSGKPILGGVCHAVSSDEGLRGVTNWDMAAAPRTGADGRFTFPRAPAGSTHVSCWTEGTWRVSNAARVIEVPRGGTATVELVGVRYPEEEGTGNLGLELDGRSVALIVTSVRPDGPAASVGVQPGDLLTAFNGVRLDGISVQGFYFLIAALPVGGSAPLSYRRGGGAEKTVTITVAPPPPR